MAEVCKDETRKINTALSSLKNRTDLYAELSNLGNTTLRRSLKDLVHSSAPGKKVGKIGWTLFWIPEPTMISSLVGANVIGLGKMMERYYSGVTIRHVGEEARKTMNALEDLFR